MSKPGWDYDVCGTTPLVGLRDTVKAIGKRGGRIVAVLPNGSHEGDHGTRHPAFLVVVENAPGEATGEGS